MPKFRIYSDNAGHDSIAVIVYPNRQPKPYVWRKQHSGGSVRYQDTGYTYRARNRDEALGAYYES